MQYSAYYGPRPEPLRAFFPDNLHHCLNVRWVTFLGGVTDHQWSQATRGMSIRKPVSGLSERGRFSFSFAYHGTSRTPLPDCLTCWLSCRFISFRSAKSDLLFGSLFSI